MTKIAIVYFSGYGHTAKQAEAVQTRRLLVRWRGSDHDPH